MGRTRLGPLSELPVEYRVAKGGVLGCTRLGPLSESLVEHRVAKGGVLVHTKLGALSESPVVLGRTRLGAVFESPGLHDGTCCCCIVGNSTGVGTSLGGVSETMSRHNAPDRVLW